MSNEKYLTIHGHFYQPPRENPWLEEIEMQESAKPFHNWNSRICSECYEPNSVSRIVDEYGHILNIVSNYEYMSFNFGPTLLSWMEKYANKAYKRIIDADKRSVEMYGGHGCAIAQVYNHMIMPLANTQDKITQTIWGIKDFEHRFNRKPEGIWLAETAVDEETLEVLIDLDIKYTILSPYQAKCAKKMGEGWYDVSWGTIDPSMPYRYYLKSNRDKYIDLFFYDGNISRAVAFECLLHDGKKFAHRLNDGYDPNRAHPQIVNIGTDGESYGHHTKFGDMALSYVLGVAAKESGFKITNYGQFLEKYPPTHEVDIKPESAWSCSHGVGRWREDCGCSTGAQAGWNQKWREPLRDAFDYLRDELLVLCKVEAKKYFTDFDATRNAYIEVILDRNSENVKRFLDVHSKKKLTAQERVKAIKLLEIQRQAMLMYTSCGWFFAEISGIETVQILCYAARAMELARDFTEQDYEKKFLSILQKAKSNIPEYIDGKVIYKKFVKPAQVTIEQIVGHWAMTDAVGSDDETSEIYCYSVKRINCKRTKNGSSELITGRVEVTSNITLEKSDMTFVLLKYADSEYYCSVKPFESAAQFDEDRKVIAGMFLQAPLVEVSKAISATFSEKYFTLKDVLIDRRQAVLEKIVNSQLLKLAKSNEEFYAEMKTTVAHLMDLGMDVPDVFRLSAKYTLTKNTEELLSSTNDFTNDKVTAKLIKLKDEADKFSININKTNAGAIFAKKLELEIVKLAETLDVKCAKNFLKMTE
ncbi:glycoside hydrolase family 57, partial [Candidatus Gastranaerophilus sp. (ex Termes propinquus)]